MKLKYHDLFPGYVLLTSEDRVQKGDEMAFIVYRQEPEWVPTMERNIGMRVHEIPLVAFRRKK